MITSDAYALQQFGGTISHCMYGLYISNNSTDTLLNISDGLASDSTNSVSISLLSSMTKSISTGFTTGSGNGGLGTGSSPINSTWYHVFLIYNNSSKASDVYFDTSTSAANIPSDFTHFRRLGSIFYTTATNITPFVQYMRTTFQRDTMLAVTTTKPTTATLITSGAPLGITCLSKFMTRINASGSNDQKMCLYPEKFGVLTMNNAILKAPYQHAGNDSGYVDFFSGTFDVESNTNAEVYYITENLPVATPLIYNYGWIDFMLEKGL